MEKKKSGKADPIDPHIQEDELYRELDRIIQRARDENKALRKLLKRVSKSPALGQSKQQPDGAKESKK